MENERWLLVVALLMCLLSACAPKEPSIGAVVPYRDLDKDYKPVEETTEFHPDETFHCSVKVSNLKGGTEITSKGFHGEELIAQKTCTAEGGSGYVGFTFTPKGTWPIGDYKVEVYLEDELAQSVSFSVMPPGGAVPSRVIKAVTCKAVDEEYKPIDPATVFAPTDTIHCSVNADLGLYSQLTAKWHYQGEILEETTFTSHKNTFNTYVDFQLESKPDFEEGDYSVEAYLDGKLAKSVDFSVEKPKAAFGPITFAEGVTEDDQPINPATSFPAGITEVWTLSECTGMTPDAEFAYQWLLNGRAVMEDSMAWPYEEQGVYADSIFMKWSKPLPAGTYEIRLYIGDELVQWASFVVEEAESTPAATMKLYTSEVLDFSIQYPEDWSFRKEEDRVMFEATPDIGLYVIVFPEVEISTQALSERIIKDMRKDHPDLEITYTGAYSTKAAEWREMDVTYTEESSKLSLALLCAVEEKTGYLIGAIAPEGKFDYWLDDFVAMVISFRFLP